MSKSLLTNIVYFAIIVGILFTIFQALKSEKKSPNSPNNFIKDYAVPGLAIAFILVLVGMLGGCATQPSVVVKTKPILIAIPDPLLMPCYITQPPPVTEYVNSDWSTKENLLTNYSISLIKNLSDCNIQLKNALVFQEKQQKLYSE